MNNFTVVVPWIIKPKGRPKVNTHTRRAYTPTETRDEEAKVATAARGSMSFFNASMSPYPQPVGVSLTLVVAKPRGAKGKNLPAHPVGYFKGDVDNIFKLVQDALNGVAYTDDRQVIQSFSNVIWGDESSTIIDVYTPEEEISQ